MTKFILLCIRECHNKNSPCSERTIEALEHFTRIFRDCDDKDRKNKVKSILVMIDETSDLGSRIKGPKYIMGATVIDDDSIDAFAKITEKRYEGEELKFHKDIHLRNEILDEASELDIRL